MSEASPEETSGPEESDGGVGAVASPGDMSPYATSGGVACGHVRAQGRRLINPASPSRAYRSRQK